jgi:hypothetical protein
MCDALICLAQSVLAALALGPRSSPKMNLLCWVLFSVKPRIETTEHTMARKRQAIRDTRIKQRQRQRNGEDGQLVIQGMGDSKNYFVLPVLRAGHCEGVPAGMHHDSSSARR